VAKLFACLWFVLAVTVPGTSESVRAGADVPAAFDAAAFAVRIVKIAFPDWGSAALDIRIAYGRMGTGHTGFWAWDTLDEPRTSGDEYLRQMWLTGNIWFDDRGLRSVQLNGRSVHGAEFKQLLHDVDLHEEWTEEQAVAALLAGNPKYPPAERVAFVSWLRRLDFRPVLGNYRVQSTDFVVRERRATPSTKMRWQVRVRTGSGQVFFLEFEPYGGRLLAIYR
jgi:hypothetical protein